MQVLVEELKEFVDVLQVSSSEDFQIEVGSFFRRRRRRSSSLDMVLVVTWPGEYFFIHCKDQLHHSGRKETLQAVHRALPRLCIQVCLDIHATPKSVAEVGVMMMLMMDNDGNDFKTFDVHNESDDCGVTFL